MQAKNHKAVTIGYVLFSLSLFCSILAAVACIWFFTLASRNEVTRIEKRSLEYDAVYEQQIRLTGKVDSLYHNLTLLNSELRINELVLQNRISTQKMNLMGTLDKMEPADALLYKRMSEKVNSMLEIKDSIRIIHVRVEQTKSELQRCIQDNRDASRKMIFSNPQ